MKKVHHSDIHGKQLSKVYLCDEDWKSLSTKTRTPHKSKLLNFDIVAGTKSNARYFLVLDNYGDEVMPNEIMKKIIGYNYFEWNLVIDKISGELYSGAFYNESGKYVLTLTTFTSKTIYLPNAYLKRIDELKNKKRPYFITCIDYSMWSVIDGWEGFNTLLENIVIDFNFDKNDVQLWNNYCREVTNWL